MVKTHCDSDGARINAKLLPDRFGFFFDLIFVDLKPRPVTHYQNNMNPKSLEVCS